MSEPASIGGAVPARPDVHAAIAHAARATGIDFSYLLAQARLESGLDPSARAANSSAAGLYQFTAGTWFATLDRHGAEHGLGWARGAGRAAALALRHDPGAAALMAAELAGDNRDGLRLTLGREPDASELYMAHFLGAEGASRFLTALSANPGQSAPALFPKAAAANRAVFFAADGAPRSLGGVMDLMRGKMAAALGDDHAMPFPSSPPGTGWGWGHNPDAPSPPQPLPDGEEPGLRPSMAETLAVTFGAGQAAMPAHVRSAYGKLRAFGL